MARYNNHRYGGHRQSQNRYNKPRPRGHDGRKSREPKKSGEYILPEDTRKTVKNPVQTVENVSLLLQKYAQFDGKAVLPQSAPSPGHDLGYYASYLSSYLEVIGKTGHAFIMKTKSRLIVGLGDESVYETGIRLLRNHGVPYIPGSALKGVTKAWAIEMMAELLEGDENLPEDFFKRAEKIQKSLNEGKTEGFPEEIWVENPSKHLREFLGAFNIDAEVGSINARAIAEELVRIFGTTDREGEIIFFDAVPSPSTKKTEIAENRLSFLQNILEFDIMNPHYGPYYQEKGAPGDWYDPVPIKFLTVRKDISFVFAVGEAKTCEECPVEAAKKLLELALLHHGVGAKTSIGYGFFKRS